MAGRRPRNAAIYAHKSVGQASACGGVQPASARVRFRLTGLYSRYMQFRYRRLPHLYVVGEPLFVTFRLHGSLPPGRQFPGRLSSGREFVCMDRLLDAQSVGPSFLCMPAIARVVVAAIEKVLFTITFCTPGS